MFILVKLKDKVRIDPNQFEKDYTTAIKDELHLRYSKKILPNVGLCVSIYEFVKIGDPYIIPGDGASFSEIEFTMIIFRPFLGEILDGIVVASDYKKGITVSVGFFHDIIIPPHLLQENTQFDEEEKLWVWNYMDGNLYMDLGEKIRFIVQSVQFDTNQYETTAPKITLDDVKPKFTSPPMVIHGRINGSGLGILRWWKEKESDDQIVEEKLLE